MLYLFPVSASHANIPAAERIDGLAFPGSLPEDPSRIDVQSRESWIPKWTNLKHIYDALSIFLIEECRQSLPIFYIPNTHHKGNPDLKAIAQHSSLVDAIILLKFCVVAASLCADRIEFLTRMQELGQGTQKVLMETLQEAQNHEQGEDSYDEGEEGTEEDDGYVDEDSFVQDTAVAQQALDEQTNARGATSDLAFEERLAKVIADNQRIAHEKRDLQRHIDDLNARYESLQERFDRGQDELNETNDRLTAVLSGRAGGALSGVAQELKNETLIATLEARIAEADSAVDELRKSNEVLRLKAERAQKLQDDYDEIKIERDKLSRKANTAEKYRQKLETSQEMEKENAALKTKIGDLQTQLRQSDSRTASSSDLQREIDEYRRLLPSIEQERHELNEMKKRLEFDHHMLQARYSESEEQLRRSRQEIEDLQGRLRDYDDGIEPSSRHDPVDEDHADPIAFMGKDLETEEADFAAAEARLTEALLKDNSNKSDAKDELTANGELEKALPNEDGISEDELRAIMAAMRAQMHAGTAMERESGMKMQKKLVVMLEKVRTRNVDLVEHVKKQSDLITELKTQPQQAAEVKEEMPEDEKEMERKRQERAEKSDAELEQQLEDQDVMIENLKREIRLISSAWYEQNQRLATLGAGGGGGAVALMRLKGGSGIEEPRSFLGRQRKLVERVIFGGNSVGAKSKT